MTHAACVGIVWSAGGNREHAGPGGDDLILGRGSGRLRGCGCTGESEDDDESANDIFHGWNSLKMISVSLSKMNDLLAV